MRLPKEQYYLDIAKEIAQRSTCLCFKVGAIIVKDDVILGSGYNGAPRKTGDCLERGNCLREGLKIPEGRKLEICRGVHAEANCIINASRAGMNVLGGDIYLWVENKEGQPVDAIFCFICKKMIINVGLHRVVSSKRDGSHAVSYIDEWTKDWEERDILDDQYQNGDNLNNL